MAGLDHPIARPVGVQRVVPHDHSAGCLDVACPVAGALRDLLASLGEPLARLVRPGGRTVIKPNLVADRDREHRRARRDRARS